MTGPIKRSISPAFRIERWLEKDGGIERELAKLEELGVQTEGRMPVDILR